MTDILEEREKRRVQILTAFGEVIRAMEYDGLMGPGQINVIDNNPNYHSYSLALPIKPSDYFIWEEILHDGS